MNKSLLTVLTGSLLLSGSLSAAESLFKEDFETDAASRWQKIDGKYWSLTENAASGRYSVSRVLYPVSTAPERPAQLPSLKTFKVTGKFDYAVRSAIAGADGLPVEARLRLIFLDAAGKELSSQEITLNSGHNGKYARSAGHVTPPAGAVTCRPVLCAAVTGPLEKYVFIRFDNLEFAPSLPQELPVPPKENTIDLEIAKLDLTFDHGGSGWKGIDGKIWKFAKGGHTAPCQLRFTAENSTALPEKQQVRSYTALPLRDNAEYQLAYYARGTKDERIAQTQILMTFRDAAGKSLGEFVSRPQILRRETFSKITERFRTPAGTVSADFRIELQFLAPPVNGYIADIDSIAVTLYKPAAPVPAWRIKLDPPTKGKWTRGNLSIGKFYRADRAPVPSLCDVAGNEWTLGSLLTDGKSGGQAFEKARYVAWKGEKPVVLTIDLGRVQKPEELKITGYRDNEAFFMWIKEWKSSVSTDGKNFTPWLSGQGAPVPDGEYQLGGKGKAPDARYIKVEFVTAGGKNSIVALDEIEVIGGIKNSWKMVPADGGVYHGAFPPSYGFKEPWRKGRKAPMSLATFEEITGKRVSMVLWYQGLAPERNFCELQDLLNIDLAENMRGPRVMSSGWLPPAPISCADIAAGKLDRYLIDYFRDAMDPAKTLNNPQPIWFRPMNEFNSGWVSWGFAPEAFRAAWRRIFNIAEQVGATERHIFVWSPNHRSYPDVGWNKMERYYPGDQYVDWVGLSCYPPSAQYTKTEGDRYPIGRCREVYQKYGDRKPMMVAEGGYSEAEACDRVRWVREWFQVPEKYPNFHAMIWENHNTRVLQGSGEPLELYRKLVQSPKWIGDLYDADKPVPGDGTK